MLTLATCQTRRAVLFCGSSWRTTGKTLTRRHAVPLVVGRSSSRQPGQRCPGQALPTHVWLGVGWMLIGWCGGALASRRAVVVLQVVIEDNREDFAPGKPYRPMLEALRTVDVSWSYIAHLSRISVRRNVRRVRRPSDCAASRVSSVLGGPGAAQRGACLQTAWGLERTSRTGSSALRARPYQPPSHLFVKACVFLMLWVGEGLGHGEAGEGASARVKSEDTHPATG